MSRLHRLPSHFDVLSSERHALVSSGEPREEVLLDRRTGQKWRWSSRAHRKGIPMEPLLVEERGWKVRRHRPILIGSSRSLGDISWWVAILFTVGSIFWCVNGILVFCFFTRTSSAYTNTEAAFGFLGGTTFWVGAYMGWVESLNPSRDCDFGWEVDHEARELRMREGEALGRARKHLFRHQPRPPSSASSEEKATPVSRTSSSSKDSSSDVPKWRWYGTSKSLGYLANSVQLVGATAFQISVICGLPGVLPSSGATGGPEQQGRSEALWVALYWAMQVFGSPAFIFAGLCFCIEVQKAWWRPNLRSIGWHIGLWNAIGGFGFWFCGIFGIWRQTDISNPEHYQKWGTAFSTFWGSWAFLIGSYIQLWEANNKTQ